MPRQQEQSCCVLAACIVNSASPVTSVTSVSCLVSCRVIARSEQSSLILSATCYYISLLVGFLCSVHAERYKDVFLDSYSTHVQSTLASVSVSSVLDVFMLIKHFECPHITFPIFSRNTTMTTYSTQNRRLKHCQFLFVYFF